MNLPCAESLAGYAEKFSGVLDLLTHGRVDDAGDNLAKLAKTGAQAFAAGSALPKPKHVATDKRAPIPMRRYIAVYNRDAWTCRYCGVRTVFTPAMILLADLFPSIFRYHPHWKREETDIAFSLIGTSCDHVLAHTAGGTNTIDNLVTACWLCNSRKLNYSLVDLGWTLRSPDNGTWDGLSSRLEFLMNLAGETKYRPWLAALKNPETGGCDRETQTEQ